MAKIKWQKKYSLKGPGANVTKAEQLRRKLKIKKGLGANVTAAERKIANTFPGSSVRKTDMFGANLTAYERKLIKKN